MDPGARAMSTGPDKPHYVPVRELAADELFEAWTGHRNDLYGVMAAEEIVKRIYEHRVSSPGQVSALLGVRKVLPPTGSKPS